MIVVEKVEYYEIDQLRKRERYYQDKENPRFGDRARITEEERLDLTINDKSGKRRRPLKGRPPAKGYRIERNGRFRSNIRLKGFLMTFYAAKSIILVCLIQRRRHKKPT